MTEQQIAKMRSVCREVRQDMANDARDFDGKPFDGRTVAEYFGNQGAAIAALANILDEVLAERKKGGA
jgi:hypothetical protein